MECGAYMKRLRTVGEEARSLYRVVARLFNQMPQQLVPRDSRSGLPTKSKGWKGLSCCWTREGECANSRLNWLSRIQSAASTENTQNP